MNGSGMPVIGDPVTIPTFTTAGRGASRRAPCEQGLRAARRDPPEQGDEQADYHEGADEAELFGEGSRRRSRSSEPEEVELFCVLLVRFLPNQPPDPTAIWDWNSWYPAP
jgi:hypothetical protein